MHRLEAVARVRQRAGHDHAHGVVEVAALHLLRDRHGADVGGTTVPRLLIVNVGQKNPARFEAPIRSRFTPRALPESALKQGDLQMGIQRLTVKYCGACVATGKVPAVALKGSMIDLFCDGR
jgi:hypothetical protein